MIPTHDCPLCGDTHTNILARNREELLHSINAGDLSAYERVRREQFTLEVEWKYRTAKAKLSLTYGLLKVSTRKYVVVKWQGCSYNGNDAIPNHKFTMLTTNLSFGEALEILNKLERKQVKESELTCLREEGE